MPNKILFQWLSVAFALWLAAAAARADETFVFRHEFVLGTSLELKVRCGSLELARQSEQQALGEIDRLERVFSTYDTASEFSRWLQIPAGQSEPVSNDLQAILRGADYYRDATSGAFQPGVQVLTQLWTACQTEQRLPLASETDEAIAQVNRPHWRLDEATGVAQRMSNAPLNLNAIAKGYIIDQAYAAALRVKGIAGVMLMIGGDLRVGGDIAPHITIADPRQATEDGPALTHVLLRERALATSGGYRRGFDIQDRHYSHIFDPRRGAPVDEIASATVVAPTAMAADALATAFNVLSVTESMQLADRLPGVACLLVDRDGQRFTSRDWEKIELNDERYLIAGATKKAEPWNGGFELKIDLEINQPGGGRLHRPYVAVWVEDKDGFPVRTLVLWAQATGQGPRWIPDLRQWYRSDKVRKVVDDRDLVATVSAATRKPGAYSIVWDGTDADGKFVTSGEYTVLIEAAREHGTYQIMRHKMKLADQPQAKALEGNVEIKSAKLDYRRVPSGNH